MTYLQKLPGNKNFYWHASTLCGLGFFSSMPGTVGSIAAFLVYPVIPVPILAIIGIIALGVWTSHRYAVQEGKKDPKEVIIDEVAGTWIAMFGLPSGFSLPALFLFRILDILKPFPVNASEKLPGGWGIMADDIVAGLLANIILTVIRWLYFGGGWNFLF
ncbi:phosphatidylglycerophosphatase A family protein [Aminivibrio sp.]|uniref:phosphatidylglycerophosphatase A family protein n=1 Tax=Aminivibrio sp. TaxID=1872489 RepID=UPI0016A43BCB|nr:phosphatidylglycerophosphatase A [Synergistaceae bacterium]